MEMIVVGIDGSDTGARALEFAADEAAVRGALLRIVTVWGVPVAAFADGMMPAVAPDLFEGYQAAAERLLDEAVGSVARSHPDVRCEGRAVEGAVSAALINEASEAKMVVLGNRGRGGFASLLLGSVCQQVVHHAPCAVVVVPAGPLR